MEIEDLFWEAIADIDSSKAEIKNLCIEVKFLEKSVRLYSTRLNNLGLAETEEHYENEHNWNISVVFYDITIDLHDPNSLIKLKTFIDDVKKNKHHKITDFKMDIKMDSEAPLIETKSGWSVKMSGPIDISKFKSD